MCSGGKKKNCAVFSDRPRQSNEGAPVLETAKKKGWEAHPVRKWKKSRPPFAWTFAEDIAGINRLCTYKSEFTIMYDNEKERICEE